MKKSESNQKGFVLPLVLIMLALLISGVSFYLTTGTSELKANVMNRDYQLCIFTAKNAMAVAQAAIEEDLNYLGTQGLAQDENGGYYSVKITRISETLRYVDIESHYNTYIKKFTGELEIMPESMGTDYATIKQFKWRMVGI